MKICHVCAAECADDAELCHVCGAELHSAEEYAAQPEEIIIEHPVLAASVEDVVTAEIFRDVLQENGIAYSCDTAESEAGMRVVFGGGFVAEDIYVDESDLDRAQQLYEDVLNAEAPVEWDFEEFEEDSSENNGESDI